LRLFDRDTIVDRIQFGLFFGSLECCVLRVLAYAFPDQLLAFVPRNVICALGMAFFLPLTNTTSGRTRPLAAITAGQ
jgi:hypothetical protein